MRQIPKQHSVLLATIYQTAGIPLDKLPYTEDFEKLHAEFCVQSRCAVTMRQLWQELVSLRKSGLLPRLQRRLG
jgi:hypothetical protein